MQPDSLRASSGSVRGVGADVAGLAGGVGRVAGGSGAAPSATAAGLEAFGARWSQGLAQAGHAVGTLGMAVDVAAGIYEQTDRSSMTPR